MLGRLGLVAATLTMAATVVLAAACGGDDDDGKDASTTGDVTAAATAGGGKSTTAPTAKQGDQPAGGLGGKELVKQRKEATFAATYAVKSSGSDATWTIAQKPPKSYIAIKQADGSAFIIIDDGVNAYSCIPQGKEGACFKSASGGADTPGTNNDALYDSFEDDAKYKEIGGKKIAGRDARCFQASGGAADGVYCLDKKDGFMLSIDTATLKIVATEVSTKIDDKLFEPPFKVQ